MVLQRKIGKKEPTLDARYYLFDEISIDSRLSITSRNEKGLITLAGVGSDQHCLGNISADFGHNAIDMDVGPEHIGVGRITMNEILPSTQAAVTYNFDEKKYGGQLSATIDDDEITYGGELGFDGHVGNNGFASVTKCNVGVGIHVPNDFSAAVIFFGDCSVNVDYCGFTIVDSRTHASESKRKCQSSAKDDRLDALESHTPNVRKRVEALSEIQSEHDKIEANFVKERAELEAEFQEKYVPLYNKRFDIVNGVEADKEADKDAEVEKGVPKFWLIAMKTNELLAKEIMKPDEGPLEHLKDVKWSRILTPKGFKLDFYFDDNPYFKNSVLTKTYHMIDDDELILENIEGTAIEWKLGKNVTYKEVGKKRKCRDGWTVDVKFLKSFFNFFKSPLLPEDYNDIDEKQGEELQNKMNQDYDVGCTIRDKIIPHAASWFTGEAAQVES
ncbi:nucleosome assembly protein 1;2-like [Papaver somniferum]|uniref:nucleosome assembly protein 1;2-like n=1 Tax=Papaver somniferum TaxID=3469 RepID=UPI000E6F9C74|nr:nucleosome assembly protein 1;2-like [Papaver somniferum]